MINGYTKSTLFLLLLLGFYVKANAQNLKTIDNNLTEQVSADYGQLLTDVWGGVNCVDDKGNNVYPSNYFTPNNCSPGCVAISAAQIYHYYEWPKTGMGNQVYKDDYSGSLKRHSAFFDNVVYDWANMLDKYKYVASTDVQQRAVGELMYHSAVALEMDFEPTGSTSNINNMPFVLENFFRFTGQYREPASYSAFWDKMKENIQNGHPVQIAIKDVDGGGAEHAAVVDGYRESDGMYHVNWGWYDNNGLNGWYDIEFGWDGAGGGYDKVIGAVFDFLPVPEITSVSVDAGNNVTVNWHTSHKVNWDAFELEMKTDDGNWQIVSSNVTALSYSFLAQSNIDVYQFRVRSKVNSVFYDDSWSNVYAVTAKNDYAVDGYISLGGSQYAYARQTPDTDLDFTNDYTFECWINVKDGNQNNDVILSQTGVFELLIDNVTSGSYAIKFTGNNSQQIISNHNDLITNNWVHIAVNHTSNDTRLYINGVQDASSSSTDFNLGLSSNALNFGERYASGYSGYIVADFDQLRLSKTNRYTGNFTPQRDDQFELDNYTIALFDFDQPHKARLNDKAANLSFKVKNEVSGVFWKGRVIQNTSQSVLTRNEVPDVVIYPNPTNGNVKVEYSNKHLLQSIDVLDIHGRLLQTVEGNSIDLDGYRAGIYILRIKIDNQFVLKKVVKQ